MLRRRVLTALIPCSFTLFARAEFKVGVRKTIITRNPLLPSPEVYFQEIPPPRRLLTSVKRECSSMAHKEAW